MRQAIAGLLLLLPAGCSMLTAPAGIKEIKGGARSAYWANYDATRRGAFILPAGEHRAICSEPSPDVAVEQTAKLLLTANYAGATGSLTPELTARVVELAGRTQVVLVLRTTLYAACEQSAAGNLSPADIRAIYSEALATVRAMTDADKATETRRAVEALGAADPATRALIEKALGDGR